METLSVRTEPHSMWNWQLVWQFARSQYASPGTKISKHTPCIWFFVPFERRRKACCERDLGLALFENIGDWGNTRVASLGWVFIFCSSWFHIAKQPDRRVPIPVLGRCSSRHWRSHWKQWLGCRNLWRWKGMGRTRSEDWRSFSEASHLARLRSTAYALFEKLEIWRRLAREFQSWIPECGRDYLALRMLWWLLARHSGCKSLEIRHVWSDHR